MPIYKRKDSRHWYVDYTDPSGRRVQVSSGTEDRRAAQELLDKLKHESWQQSRLDARPIRHWEDAVIQWFSEQEGHKRSLERDRWDFKWLDQHLCGARLDQITRADITRLAERRKREGVSNGTVNRMIALIRAVLNKAAKEWEWIDRAPAVRMLPEPKRRIRFLTREEADRLISELPEHLAEMVRFSLATGLREQNVVGLKWADVDIDRQCCWVWHDEAKGQSDIPVPLNSNAIAVVRRQRGRHPVYVFTYQGGPVTRANNHAWRKALNRAGVEDFRWHDLRHTWASWHVQAGTPIHALQELGGWKTVEMVRRYAHLSPAHLAEFAGNLERDDRVRVVPDPLQSAKSADRKRR
jgi:integrase